MIGLTGQYASVDEDLTGTENLVLIGRLLDLRGPDAKARAAQLLSDFGLAEAADRRAATYSGGMRRRLDLAASLVGRPDVIFLDEPTTGLDPAKREDVWNIIRRLVTDGVTVLLTTQYLEEADALADDISVIDHGKVIAHGTPAELKRVVGGQTVLVRPADHTRLRESAEIISAVAGRPAESPGRDVSTVPVEGDAAFTEIVARLDAAGIAVTELSLRLPSLDEVFFTLTGHHAGKEDAA
jgi:oleandomycin transport system ATP-binding protein